LTLLLAFTIGVLYSAGTYMILRRNLTKLVIGLALLGHAANLLIFTAGRLLRGQPAIVPEHGSLDPQMTADPLPQALILTAIVINFGLLAFVLALLRRSAQVTGTDDVRQIRGPER
jgi:multicomponent Na+:H+ antiporter subunit C